MPLPSRNLLLAVSFGALTSAAGLAADTAPTPPADAIQMIADMTLIDGECRDVTVDFGRAFKAADTVGLQPVDVMPTGALRAAFEAARRTRFAETPHDDLCGDVARAYSLERPGMLRLR